MKRCKKILICIIKLYSDFNGSVEIAYQYEQDRGRSIQDGTKVGLRERSIELKKCINKAFISTAIVVFFALALGYLLNKIGTEKPLDMFKFFLGSGATLGVFATLLNTFPKPRSWKEDTLPEESHFAMVLFFTFLSGVMGVLSVVV